ncbi:MAG: hypothetical protein N3B13_07650 [Deltaproteobacteria bacterium]|nr:hypothetical protein [Deltaproteobacteria bacterium]
MMKNLIILIMIFSFVSCIPRSEIGMENERCFDDGSCLNGLECNENFICVSKTGQTDIQTGDVNEINDSKSDITEAADVSETCSRNTDCSKPERPYCKLEKGICVRCFEDLHCPSDYRCVDFECIKYIYDGGVDIPDVDSGIKDAGLDIGDAGADI